MLTIARCLLDVDTIRRPLPEVDTAAYDRLGNCLDILREAIAATKNGGRGTAVPSQSQFPHAPVAV